MKKIKNFAFCLFTLLVHIPSNTLFNSRPKSHDYTFLVKKININGSQLTHLALGLLSLYRLYDIVEWSARDGNQVGTHSLEQFVEAFSTNKVLRTYAYYWALISTYFTYKITTAENIIPFSISKIEEDNSEI